PARTGYGHRPRTKRRLLSPDHRPQAEFNAKPQSRKGATPFTICVIASRRPCVEFSSLSLSLSQSMFDFDYDNDSDSELVIRHSSLVIRNSSFVIRNSSLVTRHSSLVNSPKSV